MIMRRMRASPYMELAELGDEAAASCDEAPACGDGEPLAPTLARHVDPDEHQRQAREDLGRWSLQNLPAASEIHVDDVVNMQLLDGGADFDCKR